MSAEQSPTTTTPAETPIMDRFSGVNEKPYSNGAKHLYGVNSEGKKIHISEADVLANYGYALDNNGVSQKIEDGSGASSDTEKLELTIKLSGPEDLRKHLDIVRNARNMVLWDLADVDGDNNATFKEYPNGGKLTAEQEAVIYKVTELFGKKKFGLNPEDYDPTADPALNVDNNIQQELYDLLMLSEDEFEALEAEVAAENSNTLPSKTEKLEASIIRLMQEINKKNVVGVKHNELNALIIEMRKQLDELAALGSLTKDQIDELQLLLEEKARANTVDKNTEPTEEKKLEASILNLIKNIDRKFADGIRNGDTQQLMEERDRQLDRLAELLQLTDDEKKTLLVILEQQARGGNVVPTLTPDTDPNAPDKITSPELALLSKTLDDRRIDLAKLNVRISNKVIVGEKRQIELESAQLAWRKAQADYIAQCLVDYQKETGTTLTEEEMRWLAVEASVEQSQLLTMEEAIVLMDEDNGKNKFQRAFKTYAKWYQNGGKIKKALLLAPAGLAVGLAAGAVVGAVGGGIFGAVVARGAIRGSMAAKLRQKEQSNEYELDHSRLNVKLESLNPNVSNEELAAMRGADAGFHATQLESSRNVRSNRRKVGGAALLGAVVGGVSTVAAEQIIEHVHPSWNGIKDLFHRGKSHSGSGSTTTPAPGSTAPSTVTAPGLHDSFPTSSPAPELITPPTPPVDVLPTGINPATGDLFRSGIEMPILNGHGFISSVESSGLVPKGYGQSLANFLHERGLDDGANIPGFKNLRMFHTATGSSPWSNEALKALNEFKSSNGI